MPEAILDEKKRISNSPSIKAMSAQMKQYWANAESYQKLLYITGFFAANQRGFSHRHSPCNRRHFSRRCLLPQGDYIWRGVWFYRYQLILVSDISS